MYGGTLTWRVQEGICDVFVCSVVGARLAVGWRDSGIGSHTARQNFRQRSHLHLEDHIFRHTNRQRDKFY